MFEEKRAETYKPFYEIEEDKVEPFYNKLIKKYGLKTKCKNCGRVLLKSDVKGYHSVCLWCDENFYNFEERHFI